MKHDIVAANCSDCGQPLLFALQAATRLPDASVRCPACQRKGSTKGRLGQSERRKLVAEIPLIVDRLVQAVKAADERKRRSRSIVFELRNLAATVAPANLD